ncbi:NADH-quinone oxidoreductase subunit C [Sodalis sp. RH21]|uniref:NADH-quinone oxidoreductase subunit C n=1 Tax=unclassified Sodalis (in: enterobacteria) TaxID=2636512 RepID=UPI0039B40992
MTDPKITDDMLTRMGQVQSRFAATMSDAFTFAMRTNRKGVVTAWSELGSPAMLLPAARAVKQAAGRLSTITAYQLATSQPSGVHEIAYHFDINGATLTVTVHLPENEREIDSITPIFRNADWNEREFMELYDLVVRGHPNPVALFIDPTIDPAVLQRFIPFSEMVNAASTKSLWEKIMAQRGENT